MGIVVTNTGTKPLRWLEWGLEDPLTYNPATSLMIDSDSMVTSGFSGSQVTLAGGYDPNASGTNAVGGLVYTSPQAIVGLGTLSHVGTFRVKARVMTNVPGTKVRLAWQVGDGSLSANPWQAMPIVTDSSFSIWGEVDLGSVIVPTVAAGTQKWTGRIEAYTVGGGEVYVDYLMVVPTSAGYGVARATHTYRPGVIVGLDDFAGTTAGVALNGRVAPAGGTWATSGSATDFEFLDDPDFGETVWRTGHTNASGRYALLGSAVRADTVVSALITAAAYPAVGSALHLGVIARWVNASNYLRATMTVTRPLADGSSISADLVVTQTVAGVATTLGTAHIVSGVVGYKTYVIRLIVYASGRVIADALDSTGTRKVASVEASSTALATGGALDDGLAGLFDYNPGSQSSARLYDNFMTATPAAEPVVCYPGRTISITSSDVVRQDATGVYTGRPSSYRGSRATFPVGTSRLLVRAAYEDLATMPYLTASVPLSVQVSYTSRGLVVPRG